jgi:hypothetical protein
MQANDRNRIWRNYVGFSAQVWIFGDVWCSIWLAVDVWMCTASILNLCAISLDRYVAVTRPVTYPSIMSSSRAKLLIAGSYLGSKQQGSSHVEISFYPSSL